jgi:hypothetical protein
MGLVDRSTSVLQLARRSFDDLEIAVGDHVYLTLHGQSSRKSFDQEIGFEDAGVQALK